MIWRQYCKIDVCSLQEPLDFTLKNPGTRVTIRGSIFARNHRVVPSLLLLNRLMDRQRIERQLKLAQENLSVWEKQLDADKVEETLRRKNAKWRSLDADVRTLKRRLIAVKGIEEREAAAEQRKAEKAAAE